MITNQAGGTSYEQAHLPFGTALAAESTVQNNNKRFTSYDRSVKTGLDYAINRTYDSKQGRFTQVDPIGMEAVDFINPQTFNLYNYCGNDPVNFTDPSGLFFGKLFRWIGKIFKAFNRILKWVVIAVIITAAVIAIFHSGGAAAGFLKAIFGIVGKLLGVKITTTPLIIANLLGTAPLSISVGLSGQIIAGAYAVGAVASRFASGDPPEEEEEIIKVQTDCPISGTTPLCPGNGRSIRSIIDNALGGFANGLLFGLPDAIDGWMGRDSIGDRDSPEYQVGGWIGTATSLIIPGGGGVKAFKKGGEIVLKGGKVRIAPLGNRAGDPIGRFPHYHRQRIGSNGRVMRDQGMSRHRPWERRPTDRRSRDRF